MPAPTVCTTPGCPNLTPAGRCDTCRRDARRDSDTRRPNARARGYDARWQRTRAAYLALHPTCECDNPDCREPATNVDHVDGLGPRGPRGHDPSNLRALSHACHSRRTARDQPGGWNR